MKPPAQSLRRLPGQVVLYLIILSGTMGAVWRLGTFAEADRQMRLDTPSGLRRSVALDPLNCEAWLRLANVELWGGAETPQTLDFLRKAADCAAAEGSARLALGLELEFRGDPERARIHIEQALLIDRTADTRLAAAGFYQRMGDSLRMLAVCRAILERHPEPAVFAVLASSNLADSEVLAEAIPPLREAEAAYLRYLIHEQHWGAAGEAARRLLLHATAEEAPTLLAYTELLMRQGQFAEAGAVWNAMGGRRLGPRDSVGGSGLLKTRIVNSVFRRPMAPPGFDWRTAGVKGVEVRFEEPDLAVEMDGYQPERAELVSQLVWLPEPGKYVYRVQCRGSRPVESGLRWQIREPGVSQPVAELPVCSSLDPEPGNRGFAEVRFSHRAGPAIQVSLVHQRQRGTTRAAGVFRLRDPQLLLLGGIDNGSSR